MVEVDVVVEGLSNVELGSSASGGGKIGCLPG